MYDITKRIKANDTTVGEVIEGLQKLPSDAKFLVCGDERFFVHIEKDESVVSFDTEDLDEEYANDEGTSPEDYWKNR